MKKSSQTELKKGGLPGGDLPLVPNLLRAPNLKISLKLKKAPSKSRQALGIKGPVYMFSQCFGVLSACFLSFV